MATTLGISSVARQKFDHLIHCGQSKALIGDGDLQVATPGEYRLVPRR